MNALEWIVMIEAVLLVALILFSAAGYVIARNDPQDPIVTFCRTFWHEFLHPPIEATARGGKPVKGKPAARAAASSESPAPSRQLGKNKKDEDAMSATPAAPRIPGPTLVNVPPTTTFEPTCAIE